MDDRSVSPMPQPHGLEIHGCERSVVETGQVLGPLPFVSGAEPEERYGRRRRTVCTDPVIAAHSVTNLSVGIGGHCPR